METIKHAAVKTEGGYIVISKSHSDCMEKARSIGMEICRPADAQGFMTSQGRFVTRGEAAKIAVAAGQVDDTVTVLMSEDLWLGRCPYNSVRGYEE